MAPQHRVRALIAPFLPYHRLWVVVLAVAVGMVAVGLLTPRNTATAAAERSNTEERALPLVSAEAPSVVLVAAGTERAFNPSGGSP